MTMREGKNQIGFPSLLRRKFSAVNCGKTKEKIKIPGQGFFPEDPHLPVLEQGPAATEEAASFGGKI